MKRMKIGFIGAGKVGTALGIFFKHHRLSLTGYLSRSETSSQCAANVTDSTVFYDLPSFTAASDVIFITTGDDQISAVINQLLQTTCLTKHHTLIHTSGALSTDLFDPLLTSGCGLCSLHPIMSFSDPLTASKNLKQTVFTLEGNQPGRIAAQKILAITGNPYSVIDKNDKVLYHAAACILSNYLVTLVDSGFELLKTTGIAKDEIIQAFMPLITATLGNIEKLGTVNALTGPLVRGDENTISKHIKALKTQTPEFLSLYQTMGLSTIEMIKDKRIDAETYNHLEPLLK
ncbi:Rossmann-like and DUF2520 domain-containing protein [Acetobacterium wieringae]|uniref:Rossmann-like and DUF2520 domain-containing protein n=1 Tax=Acetobacterium wieringae TaxID=52694 RepID=UPI0026F0C7FA|nr:Rossmann-like and DUF2520 domain-containing protein [Acetobacterium wieringae]